MRVLVTWGSERGGTEGIARTLAEALRRDGIDVEARSCDDADTLDPFDAVIVGGALYANRWHRAARRFVRRHVDELRCVPVWFFSSGPLDASADRDDLDPTPQVANLMMRVGARGHVTFGGRLAADATGFPARAMARTHAGDWRNPARIRAWADELAVMLPTAHPGVAADPEARSVARLGAYVGLLAVAMMAVRYALTPVGAGLALSLHAVLAAGLALALAGRYFLPRGARDPLPSAAVFAGVAALLDVAVLSIVGDAGTSRAVVGIAVTAAAVFLAVWSVGGVVSTLPWRRPSRTVTSAPVASVSS